MRRFNGTSDYAKFAVGTPSAGASNAYGTMFAIGQFTGGSKQAILIGNQSATNPNTIAFWVTAGNNLMASWGSDVTGPTSAGTIPTGSICFVAVSKATGTATPRFH